MAKYDFIMISNLALLNNEVSKLKQWKQKQ